MASQPSESDGPRLADLQESATVYVDADPASMTIAEVQGGRRVLVIDTEADPLGNEWLLIEFEDYSNASLAGRFGWIVGQSEGGDIVEPVDAECPPELDIGFLAAMHPELRRSCAEDAPLRVRGFLRRFEAPSANIGDPEWLAADPVWLLAASNDDAATGGAIPVHFHPDSGAPKHGSEVVVVGSFDHDAANACRRRPRDPELPEDPRELQVLWCRQQFVITSIEGL